jgi:hypothetical protein
MDDVSFWDWVYANENEQLRKDLGYEVTKNLDKKAILSMARYRPSLAQKYGVRYATHFQNTPPKPNNFGRDPSFKSTPFAVGAQFADIATFDAPEDEAQFCDFVSSLVSESKWELRTVGSGKTSGQEKPHVRSSQLSDSSAYVCFWPAKPQTSMSAESPTPGAERLTSSSRRVGGAEPWSN